MYLYFTGRTTGFSFFRNVKQAIIEKRELERFCDKYDFKKNFKIKYIGNIWDIPVGKMVIKTLSYSNKKNSKFII